MGGVRTLVGLFLLVGCSWALGTLALWRVEWPDLRAYERASLKVLAGLGLTAILIALLTLAHRFAAVTSVVAVLAVAGVILAVRDRSQTQPRVRNSPASTRATAIGLLIVAGLGCLGAIAPVTDDDALAYVVPIAQHIVKSGALTVWPDQARSMWPQSQQVLLAYLLAFGGDRLGALTALEWLLALGTASALARRVCDREAHIPAALIIAFGAPVGAFLIASAKEDLLVVAAAGATAVCLVGAGGVRNVAAAGLFAGIAAGAKYPGASVALSAALWPLVARRPKAWRDAMVIALCAAVTGGLWYGLNLWRYGNPVAPFIGGARGTTLDGATARAFMDGYGGGRSALAFVFAPLHIFLEPGRFCGRGNLFNPLAYVGLVGLCIPAIRRRHAPLFFIAAITYVVWFFTLQNARFLLPAVLVLAPAAADCVMPALRRSRALRPLAWTAAVVCVGLVAAVGSLRAIRYVENPATYLERETQNYADIRWMNAHLNHGFDRVASDHKVLAYLDTPWLVLDPTYQIEIGSSEFDDPERFLNACRRQGITHLFGRADSFSDLRTNVRVIYQNPSSRLGGTRFFREPLKESTAVFEIVYSATRSAP
jgi:hypothetical protein